jgi:hypothetical protein
MSKELKSDPRRNRRLKAAHESALGRIKAATERRNKIPSEQTGEHRKLKERRDAAREAIAAAEDKKAAIERRIFKIGIPQGAVTSRKRP